MKNKYNYENQISNQFYNAVIHDIEQYKTVKEIKARPNQPANFCSVSSIPWLSFTGFAQDTYEVSDLLFPLIRFGKYFSEQDKVLIPLAVFVNHAVADGYHTSKLINDIQDYASKADEWIV
ncbi:CatA-like O-acetyltransferase [uncultured Bacteroides sp.]|uniref:CatA-like O-acetyltransferase n=1 Tax=uncultured Bacteroides sp. TaxID=162156 RepID=UPI002AA735D2|nr:CatA-like O-acetyltransferase [uncultured Bacteroides sp.]